MTNEVKKCIALIFPEDAQDRTQRILKRLRNDNDKDHHNPGSLTYLGRCAVDRAAADLIESLLAQLGQITRERDALLDELKGECDVCANRKDCTAPKCRKSQHKECEKCPCYTCIYDTNWKWEGVKVNQ